ncbi:MAG: prephenate dehydrogenase/arogenate dehydrogenase family protein [Actinomycetia bacterium]|nr:prephenate dehydrogenase/arogenate dehydrogenase family protein [Actinomycetes bacterium]
MTLEERRTANIVGLGLIGGSVALALRQQGWHVNGIDTVADRQDEALERGAIDMVCLDRSADITFVAIPASSVPLVAEELLESTAGLVTDVASVKSRIVSAVDNPRFVGGHPMAGSEQEGLGGSRADMFQGAVWVLTPSAATADETVAVVASVLRSLGADVLAVDAERHDEIVAVVSHVPHLTAAALMRLADARSVDHVALLRLAAGGFRDMTRVAAGHPAIWPDICVENQEAIVAVIDALVGELNRLRSSVAESDRDAIFDSLREARAARTNLPSSAPTSDQLAEVRIPIPDRPGSAAEVFTLAGELAVNVYDFEVAHSPEGDFGVMVLVIEADQIDLFRGGLLARGFRPGVRELA